MPRGVPDPDQVRRWVAFLQNHKDVIASMDFFTVPTVSLTLLYVLFVIEVVVIPILGRLHHDYRRAA